MKILLLLGLFVAALHASSTACAQQADARDFELGFAPNNTVALNAYARHEFSDGNIRDYSLTSGILRITHLLKRGNWGFTPLDALLPLANLNVFAPLSPDSPVRGTLHRAGFGDAVWIPSLGYGWEQDPSTHTHTWVVVTSYVTLPTGAYDPNKALNIGANRWQVRPQLTIGQRFAKAFTLEGFLNLGFYTANTEYRVPGQVLQAVAEADPSFVPQLQGNKKLTQEMGVSAAILGALDLSPTCAISASYYYSRNGRQEVEGALGWTPQAVEQAIHTLRFGFTYRVEKQTQLLFQFNQDLSTEGGAPATRGLFLRLTHVFFPPPG